ncbi:hypothetical protein HYQ46_009797 [Verticillium longisporum]|nr:hypothetical protein HYQ46_009797 [Verticillium longisporum]
MIELRVIPAVTLGAWSRVKAELGSVPAVPVIGECICVGLGNDSVVVKIIPVHVLRIIVFIIVKRNSVQVRVVREILGELWTGRHDLAWRRG